MGDGPGSDVRTESYRAAMSGSQQPQQKLPSRISNGDVFLDLKINRESVSDLIQRGKGMTGSNTLRMRYANLCVDVGPDRKRVLHGVTGQPAPGRVMAVMGPTGSGKTTFLHTVSHRVPPSDGWVRMPACPVSMATNHHGNNR